MEGYALHYNPSFNPKDDLARAVKTQYCKALPLDDESLVQLKVDTTPFYQDKGDNVLLYLERLTADKTLLCVKDAVREQSNVFQLATHTRAIVAVGISSDGKFLTSGGKSAKGEDKRFGIQALTKENTPQRIYDLDAQRLPDTQFKMPEWKIALPPQRDLFTEPNPHRELSLREKTNTDPDLPPRQLWILSNSDLYGPDAT